MCTAVRQEHLADADLPQTGVPAIWLSDGPNGLRKQAGAADHLGLNPSEPATCFPPAATIANSWDPDWARPSAGRWAKKRPPTGSMCCWAPA